MDEPEKEYEVCIDSSGIWQGRVVGFLLSVLFNDDVNL
jgi:hypothetical protein